MKKNNSIAKYFESYQALLAAFQNDEDPTKQFFDCYCIVDNMDYLSVHYLLTNIKAFHNCCELKTGISYLDALLEYIDKDNYRRLYLIEVLEEARTRKRKSTDNYSKNTSDKPVS